MKTQTMLIKYSPEEFADIVMNSRWQSEYYEDVMHLIDIVINFDDNGKVSGPNPSSELQLAIYWDLTGDEIEKLFNGWYDEEERQFLEKEGYEKYLEHYENVIKPNYEWLNS